MDECVVPCWWGECVWIAFVIVIVVVRGCVGLVLRINQFLFGIRSVGCHVIRVLGAAISILRGDEW